MSSHQIASKESLPNLSLDIKLAKLAQAPKSCECEAKADYSAPREPEAAHA